MKTIFKEGMTVYWGEMKGIVLEKPFSEDYPVAVDFGYWKQGFTFDGRIISKTPPILSTTPYTLSGFSQVKPIEKDQVVYVRQNDKYSWSMLYFSHYDENGNARCFRYQMKSHETSDTASYKFIETENPLL